MKGRPVQVPKAQSDGKLKEEEAGQLRKIKTHQTEKHVCYDSE